MRFLEPLKNTFNQLLGRNTPQPIPEEEPTPAEFADFRIISDAIISIKEMKQINMVIHETVKKSLGEIKTKLPDLEQRAIAFTSQLEEHTDHLVTFVQMINECEDLKKKSIAEGSINPRKLNPFLISVGLLYSNVFQDFADNIKLMELLKPVISFDGMDELKERYTDTFAKSMGMSRHLTELLTKDFNLPTVETSPTQEPH